MPRGAVVDSGLADLHVCTSQPRKGPPHTLGAQQAGSGLGTGPEAPPCLALRARGCAGCRPHLHRGLPLSPPASRPACLALLKW